MSENNLPTFADICLAHRLISPHIHRTPVMTSESINKITGANLYFKCENFQKVGAFKYRGATNAVLSLHDELAAKGVATHSSGNHAAALALAAQKREINAYIVMPKSAPEIKKKAVAGYGGIITFCEPTLQARESTLAKIIAQTGAIEIHPYNNFQVICGQGTAAKEFLEEFGDLEIVIAPVGGGGLLSGTSISAKAINPSIQVIGAEPLNADDAYRSFISGKIRPALQPNTIADGLLTALGTLTFPIIQRNVDSIIRCSESSILEAMQLIWERMKIIVEPSSAVALAIILENPDLFRNKKTGVILSGGNVDLSRFFLH
jgi:threonine dehydratase